MVVERAIGSITVFRAASAASAAARFRLASAWNGDGCRLHDYCRRDGHQAGERSAVRTGVVAGERIGDEQRAGSSGDRVADQARGVGERR
jgi:hypothetical protein